MNKSDLFEVLHKKNNLLLKGDIEQSVNFILEHISDTLVSGDRVEIRGFGSFSLRYRAPRLGRNPKTGQSVGLAGKYVPHFKPGKILRDKVNNFSRD